MNVSETDNPTMMPTHVVLVVQARVFVKCQYHS